MIFFFFLKTTHRLSLKTVMYDPYSLETKNVPRKIVLCSSCKMSCVVMHHATSVTCSKCYSTTSCDNSPPQTPSTFSRSQSLPRRRPNPRDLPCEYGDECLSVLHKFQSRRNGTCECGHYCKFTCPFNHSYFDDIFNKM